MASIEDYRGAALMLRGSRRPQTPGRTRRGSSWRHSGSLAQSLRTVWGSGRMNSAVDNNASVLGYAVGQARAPM